ncbi:MAG: divalent-cation tolerance protein CutA [Chromatiaceae bacterium]|nr:divalent-cation tolerance protein CutA [Chromatiaceae bacterium]MCP5315356.1 divalent-cation tolerance protein CutA [Chromatiaceae bacterium]
MPDQESGEKLAQAMVQARLAGCVNISAPVTSFYEWQGRLERGTEVMLTIKTAAARYAELQSFIIAQHPYELPEVIAVPITEGLADYLKWIEACTTS